MSSIYFCAILLMVHSGCCYSFKLRTLLTDDRENESSRHLSKRQTAQNEYPAGQISYQQAELAAVNQLPLYQPDENINANQLPRDDQQLTEQTAETRLPQQPDQGVVNHLTNQQVEKVDELPLSQAKQFITDVKQLPPYQQNEEAAVQQLPAYQPQAEQNDVNQSPLYQPQAGQTDANPLPQYQPVEAEQTVANQLPPYQPHAVQTSENQLPQFQPVEQTAANPLPQFQPVEQTAANPLPQYQPVEAEQTVANQLPPYQPKAVQTSENQMPPQNQQAGQTAANPLPQYQQVEQTAENTITSTKSKSTLTSTDNASPSSTKTLEAKTEKSNADVTLMEDETTTSLTTTTKTSPSKSSKSSIKIKPSTNTKKHPLVHKFAPDYSDDEEEVTAYPESSDYSSFHAKLLDKMLYDSYDSVGSESEEISWLASALEEESESLFIDNPQYQQWEADAEKHWAKVKAQQMEEYYQEVDVDGKFPEVKKTSWSKTKQFNRKPSTETSHKGGSSTDSNFFLLYSLPAVLLILVGALIWRNLHGKVKVVHVDQIGEQSTSWNPDYSKHIDSKSKELEPMLEEDEKNKEGW